MVPSDGTSKPARSERRESRRGRADGERGRAEREASRRLKPARAGAPPPARNRAGERSGRVAPAHGSGSTPMLLEFIGT